MLRFVMSLVLLGAALCLLAESPENAHRTAFKADSELVLVPVTVLDRRGATVNGLHSDAFTIAEDKLSRQIFSFTEQDVPASIGVILDMSGSMKATLTRAEFAVRSFLDTANPDDEAFLYSVSSRPVRDTGFTGDLTTLLSGVALSEASGSTALVDTIYCGLHEMRSAHRPRKALLIISDGIDNHSRYSKSELLERVLESDVQIYTIAIDDSPAYAKPIQLEQQRQGLTFLQDLAGKTGGLSFIVRSSEDIARAAARVGSAIRNEYTIGYVPAATNRDGKWHAIHVKLTLPGLKAYARSGYYAR